MSQSNGHLYITCSDGKSIIVNDKFISDFYILKENSNDNVSKIQIPFDSLVLYAMQHPPKSTLVCYNSDEDLEFLIDVLKCIDYLEGNSKIWSQWIYLLPFHYPNILSCSIVDKIWTTSGSPIPRSYFRTYLELEDYNRCISMIEDVLGVNVNHTYMSYVIKRRIQNKMTLKKYINVLMSPVLSENTFYITQEDNVYAYMENLTRGLSTGCDEILHLVHTCDNDYIPKNIITYSPGELSANDLHSLIEKYPNIEKDEKYKNYGSFMGIVRKLIIAYTKACKNNPENPPQFSENKCIINGDNQLISIKEIMVRMAIVIFYHMNVHCDILGETRNDVDEVTNAIVKSNRLDGLMGSVCAEFIRRMSRDIAEYYVNDENYVVLMFIDHA